MDSEDSPENEQHEGPPQQQSRQPQQHSIQQPAPLAFPSHPGAPHQQQQGERQEASSGPERHGASQQHEYTTENAAAIISELQKTLAQQQQQLRLIEAAQQMQVAQQTQQQQHNQPQEASEVLQRQILEWGENSLSSIDIPSAALGLPRMPSSLLNNLDFSSGGSERSLLGGSMGMSPPAVTEQQQQPPPPPPHQQPSTQGQQDHQMRMSNQNQQQPSFLYDTNTTTRQISGTASVTEQASGGSSSLASRQQADVNPRNFQQNDFLANYELSRNLQQGLSANRTGIPILAAHDDNDDDEDDDDDDDDDGDDEEEEEKSDNSIIHGGFHPMVINQGPMMLPIYAQPQQQQLQVNQHTQTNTATMNALPQHLQDWQPQQKQDTSIAYPGTGGGFAVTTSSIGNTNSPMNLHQRVLRLDQAMERSVRSQRLIQDWDAKMGLRRCHSKTMRQTTESRKKVQELMVSTIMRGGIGAFLFVPKQA